MMILEHGLALKYCKEDGSIYFTDTIYLGLGSNQAGPGIALGVGRHFACKYKLDNVRYAP